MLTFEQAGYALVQSREFSLQLLDHGVGVCLAVANIIKFRDNLVQIGLDLFRNLRIAGCLETINRAGKCFPKILEPGTYFRAESFIIRAALRGPRRRVGKL